MNSRFLWFDGHVEAAARHHVDIFDNAATGTIARYTENMLWPVDIVLPVEIAACGLLFKALNAGSAVAFTKAVSIITGQGC